jgi:hypothetical protein
MNEGLTTLMRPFRRRDAVIALCCLLAAAALAVWLSDMAHFPDTASSASTTDLPDTKKTRN